MELAGTPEAEPIVPEPEMEAASADVVNGGRVMVDVDEVVTVDVVEVVITTGTPFDVAVWVTGHIVVVM